MIVNVSISVEFNVAEIKECELKQAILEKQIFIKSHKELNMKTTELDWYKWKENYKEFLNMY